MHNQRNRGKRTLHNWWRISGQQVFYTAIKKKEDKTEKERRKGGNSQPSETSGKDNTELCIIFLILYLR